MCFITFFPDKEEKERNKKKVFDLWLACNTQRDIAEMLSIDHKTVGNWIEDLGKSLESKLFPKFNFQDDFQIPIYNVWKLQNKTNGVSHFGNSEQQWLENLLYLYTNPFDKEEQKMVAYRLHRLGWTQEEQANSIGYSSQGSYNRDYLSQFPELENEIKKLLNSGHPHIDVAERFNMPLILVWSTEIGTLADYIGISNKTASGYVADLI